MTGEVLRHVQTRAVLSSVAGLDDPRPSLWQHLTSWARWTTCRVETSAGASASRGTP